jgi:hypothetical protein
VLLKINNYNKIKIENAARAYGLEDAELFQTIDLYEKRNIPQVTKCLYTLGRHVSYHFIEVVTYFFIIVSFRHKKRNLMVQYSVLKCPKPIYGNLRKNN